MSFSTVSKSNKSTEYGTPQDFFDKLNNIFHFKLDPCTTKDNPLGTERFFTQKEDGLDQEWNGNTYVNPPFGSRRGNNIINWINKMKNESIIHTDNIYVMLLPARVETLYVQNSIWKFHGTILHLIRGRLKFVNPILNSKSQPHIIGSMLWLLGNISDNDIKKLNEVIPGITIKYKGDYV